MTRLVLALGLLASFVSAPAAVRDATLFVTVIDPSGGVLPQATVTVRESNSDGANLAVDAAAAASASATAVTSDSGVATISGLAPGRYTIEAEFSGFETGVVTVAVRAGERKRITVTLALQKVEDSMTVSRDAQAAAADPRGPAFGTALTREEIDALSDDPAEMLQQLLDIAGGTATIRVDGFNGGTTGGALPPKSIIKSIRIDRGRFAAEHHSPDYEDIEIVTQPGTGPLRGGGSWRVRDGALSGRSPFTSTIGPERTQQWQANIGGTLVRTRASFSLSAGGTTSFDTPMLNVALPGGGAGGTGAAGGTSAGTRAELLNLRRPNDSWTTYDLFDYAVTPNQLLRVAYVQNHRTRRNLGVGGYDLAERAYASDAQDHEIRIQQSGPIGTRLFATTRFGLHWSDTSSRASVESPTIRVLDAFTSGGAQVAGGRHARELEFAADIDYSRGQHAIRAGFEIEGGMFRSDETSNYLGTYIFPSLAAFAAGQPASYTRRVGDPLVRYGNLTAGAYIEDDVRVGKQLTLSAGARYEAQTHIDGLGNLSPRVAATWAPFASGRTTLRLTYGYFYEWLNPGTYEQTLRLDGFRQQELNVFNPAYPFVGVDDGGGGAVRPPTNRYVLARDVPLATTQRLDLAIEQAIDAHVRTNVSYYIDRDDRVLRGRNLNAPIDGIRRPDPAFANVIEAVPDAAFRGGQFQANLNINLAPPGRVPQPPLFDWRRQTLRVSYIFSRQDNNYDAPFSVPASGTLATEWGPAPFNRRHRVQASFTSQAIRNLTAVLNLAANTGTPYSITTGFDDNGDSMFNDRPAGVGRNTLRMPGQSTLAANLSYAMGLGRDPQTKRDRYRLTWTVNAMNLTNHANYGGFSGVQTSPFFMRPTTVQNPRKVDIGMSVTF
jgi:hypothetical protein